MQAIFQLKPHTKAWIILFNVVRFKAIIDTSAQPKRAVKTLKAVNRCFSGLKFGLNKLTNIWVLKSVSPELQKYFFVNIPIKSGEQATRMNG